MTFDNLLSGFIGAVIGAALVIAWERWVWRHENKAAARLVLSELQMNEGYIDVARMRDPSALSMLTIRAWEAEQVRVASLLNPKELMTVITAYESIHQILQLQTEMGKAEAQRWAVEADAGLATVTRALVMSRKASEILADKVPPPSTDVIAEWRRDVEQELQKPSPSS